MRGNYVEISDENIISALRSGIKELGEKLNAAINACDTCAVERDAAKEENSEILSLVKDWFCETCNTLYPGPAQDGVKCVQCPKCKGFTMPKYMVEARNAKRDAEVAKIKIAELEKEVSEMKKMKDAFSRIKFQCAGHCDEFSGRVWQIANKAIGGNESIQGEKP